MAVNVLIVSKTKQKKRKRKESIFFYDPYKFFIFCYIITGSYKAEIKFICDESIEIGKPKLSWVSNITFCIILLLILFIKRFFRFVRLLKLVRTVISLIF